MHLRPCSDLDTERVIENDLHLTFCRGKVIIVGAGPAGSTTAILLAKRGYAVEVYERRPQPKSDPIDLKRTYIIALSERGLKAMRAAGVRIPSDSPYKGFVRHTQGGKIQVDCNIWTNRDKFYRKHAGEQIAVTLCTHTLHV